jgi:hypothetical protein
MANGDNPQPPAKLKPSIVESSEPVSKKSKTADTPPSQRLMGLVAYFLALLLLALGGLVHLLLLANYSSGSLEILRTLGFMACGAMVGSVLFQIRMLFRRYYEGQNHEQGWLGECLSTPWESVALAAVALSLIRGGAFLLGGYAGGSSSTAVPPEMAKAYGFVGFGAGALVGFGTREITAWLRNVMRAMFPAVSPEPSEVENHSLRRSKAS